jgi:hypothetical protein
MLNFACNSFQSPKSSALLGAMLMVLALGAACNSGEESSENSLDPCTVCESDESCVDGVCYGPGCPPEGPYGTHPGDMLTDVIVYDCDDNPVHLHSMCGANVGYFNLLAGW